jgi:type IV pilus assembly protein PilQ
LKKKISSYFFFLLAAVLVASCASKEVLDKTGLLNPEQFIEDQRSEIKRNVSLGPNVDLTQEELSEARERVRINEQQPLNYISLNDSEEDYFPITVNLDNVGIRDAMRMLAEITGTNILLGDEVEGEITAFLQEVPWNIALDSMLKIEGLAHHIDLGSNITRIHAQDALVAQEDFDRKRLEDLRKSIEAQRAVQPMYTELFHLYYSDSSTVKTQIEGVLSGNSSSTDATGATGSGSGGGGLSVTVDKRTNTLVVKATRNELDLIARLVSEIDVRTPQILIEAFIVEATDDFTRELGARLGYNDASVMTVDGSSEVLGLGGITSTAGTPTLGSAVGSIAENMVVAGATGGIGGLLTTGTATLKVELNALESEGLTRILSNPRVYALNNQQAVIKQGWEIPYSAESESGGTDIEFKEAMLVLTVTPSIVGDGNIRLDIKVEKKDADETVENPPLQAQEITTKLMVRNETVVVIGGVKKRKTIDTTSKVPFFGDIPWLGNLFRYRLDDDKFEEILIFIAPTVM